MATARAKPSANQRFEKGARTMQRLAMVAGHLMPEDGSANASSNVCTRSDCVIVAAKRTPFGKAGKGGLSQVPVEDLVSPVFRALLADKSALHVDEVLMGKVAGDSGMGHMAVRRAMFIAGLDETTSCAMMNRACASGLETIATMHAKITTNQVKVGIAG
jgi:acetyl-CoA acyltransferase